MRQDDEEFSKKSETHRKNYLSAVNGLYGEKQDIPLKPLIKRKVKRRSRYTEEEILQIKLVSWAKDLSLDMNSIPNHGRRSYWEGQKQVAMGLTKGVSDVFLSHMRQGYGGYWIELKAKGKEPTFEQYAWIAKKRKDGYKADWFDDFDKAKQAIEQYMYGMLPCA